VVACRGGSGGKIPRDFLTIIIAVSVCSHEELRALGKRILCVAMIVTVWFVEGRRDSFSGGRNCLI
jgi:hypothetical protein